MERIDIYVHDHRDANSSEYERISAETTMATKAFSEAQKAYRERKIGDKEFLEARRKHAEALKKFDAAFEAEQQRQEKISQYLEKRALRPPSSTRQGNLF